jgi:hypothetical protein
VWRVLTDFAAFPDWNPFIRRVEGEVNLGGRLRTTVEPRRGKRMTFRPVLLAVKPSEELRWLGHLGVPGLFDGEHTFAIERLGDGSVRFVQSERFGGLLVPLLWRIVDGEIRRGFDDMNEALKLRCESEPPSLP